MLYTLKGTPPSTPFPDVAHAETEPDGLLAMGGDLAPQRLINAYRHGIFPWYSDHQPILWWSPDPRMVLFPEKLHISRSLRKTLRKGVFSATLDRAFEAVIRACAEPRDDGAGTWLVEDMIQAYLRLHRRCIAHSAEVWQDGELAGGLYGVALGQVFFGESMFSRRNDASKAAFVYLVRALTDWGYRLIDCQVRSDHLLSLGAEEIPRHRFTLQLQRWTTQPGKNGNWDNGGAAPPVTEPSDPR
jgi:leucyl/phenylalanyl-tRNA--protein transferase